MKESRGIPKWSKLKRGVGVGGGAAAGASTEIEKQTAAGPKAWGQAKGTMNHEP